MRLSDLDYTRTVFAYSPKCGKRMKTVGSQYWLAREAESRANLTSFEFPGPTISLLGDRTGAKRALAMTVMWRDGVTGAFDFLTEHEIQEGLRNQVEESVKAIGLRCEVFEYEFFRQEADRLRAWSAVVRYLHPKLLPSQWPLSEQIARLIVEEGARTVREAAQYYKVDAQTMLVAAAHLIYIGRVLFNHDRGTYDFASRLRSPA